MCLSLRAIIHVSHLNETMPENVSVNFRETGCKRFIERTAEKHDWLFFSQRME